MLRCIGELGRYPLYISHYVCIITYSCKIMSSNNILIQYMYNTPLIDSRKGTNNWFSNVQYLDNYGCSYVLGNPCAINLNTFHLEFKLRALDVFNKVGLVTFL